MWLKHESCHVGCTCTLNWGVFLLNPELGSYVNHMRCSALHFNTSYFIVFFKHMHWIISHHILQSGACQRGVAMETPSVHCTRTHTHTHTHRHTPSILLPTPLQPPHPPFSSSFCQAANRTEKNKAWENTLVAQTMMVGVRRKSRW